MKKNVILNESEGSIKTLVDSYKGAEDYENYYKMLEELFGEFYDRVKNGKIQLPTVSGPTKKGRISVVIDRYV